MASRRPLFFADVNSTSDGNLNFQGNTTLDCIANCIGVCIYSVCFPPPSLPPDSLPNDSNSSDVVTPINVHRRDRVTPTLVITAVSAVAGSFAFLLILYAYLRFRRRARRRHRPPGSEVVAGSVNDNDDEIGGDLPPGGDIEHHIWYIRTQGLDDSTIASITSWVYKSSDGLIDSRDCSVCLGEFHDGELVRLLPKCNHPFHLPCIDRWLRSHVNCPLCRAPIVYPATAVVPAPSPASPATVVISEPAEPVTGAPVSLENTQIEVLPWESGREEIEIGIVTHSSEGSSSRPSISEMLTNSSEEEDTLQPIRRSVSMDTFSLDVLLRGERAEEELQGEEGMASANRKKPRGFLKGKWMREQPKKMERSLSSQSARWFFSRYGRPRNTVLPL